MENMKKISQKKIPPEKVYHIYLRDRCVLHSLSEDQFRNNWELLSNLVGVMKTDYSLDDLSYELVDKLSIGSEEASY
jgi:hypothetical protein